MHTYLIVVIKHLTEAAVGQEAQCSKNLRDGHIAPEGGWQREVGASAWICFNSVSDPSAWNGGALIYGALLHLSSPNLWTLVRTHVQMLLPWSLWLFLGLKALPVTW